MTDYIEKNYQEYFKTLIPENEQQTFSNFMNLIFAEMRKLEEKNNQYREIISEVYSATKKAMR